MQIPAESLALDSGPVVWSVISVAGACGTGAGLCHHKVSESGGQKRTADQGYPSKPCP